MFSDSEYMANIIMKWWCLIQSCSQRENNE